jgi:hypothetical protein
MKSNYSLHRYICCKGVELIHYMRLSTYLYLKDLIILKHIYKQYKMSEE